VKVALTVLSSANLQKKYQYLFSQLADHNNCISSNKFEILLKNLICIAEYLNESTAFGHKFITSAVEGCSLKVHHWHLCSVKFQLIGTLHIMQVPGYYYYISVI